MGGDGWPSEVLMEMAGDAVEGSFIVNHLDIADPIVKELQINMWRNIILNLKSMHI